MSEEKIHELKVTKPMQFIETLDHKDWSVDLDHFHCKGFEICEQVEHVDVPATKLLEILASVEVKAEHTEHWDIWGSKLSHEKSGLTSKIKTVVDYAEGGATKSANCKNMLRVVAKMIEKLDTEHKIQILLLIAAHGSVCDVQKEIGISMAYHMLTNTVEEAVKQNSMESHILRICKNQRELIIEELFIKLNGKNINSHPLTGFRNGMVEAANIGLTQVPDIHTSTRTIEKKTVDEFFNDYYTPKRLINALSHALNSRPRKIPQEMVVDWFKNNLPANIEESYEFLEKIYDEKGNFKPEASAYILQSYGLIKIAGQKEVESLSTPIQAKEANPEASTGKDGQ